MIRKETTAPSTDPAPECFACYEGLVFIGHLVEDECGVEFEVFEAYPCRRCAEAAREIAAKSYREDLRRIQRPGLAEEEEI